MHSSCFSKWENESTLTEDSAGQCEFSQRIIIYFELQKLMYKTCVDSWTDIPAESMPSDPSDSGSWWAALMLSGQGNVELLSAWN